MEAKVEGGAGNGCLRVEKRLAGDCGESVSDMRAMVETRELR